MVLRNFCLFLYFAFILVSCQTNSESDSNQWPQGMRGMSEILEELIPYIYDSERFSDPNNKTYISTKLMRFESDSSLLKAHTAKGLSGDDPLFEVGLKNLKNTIQKASDSFSVDNYEYSQTLLQNSINYCVQCHTNSRKGPRLVTIDHFKNSLDKISPIELAKIYIATRNFEKALDTLYSFYIDQANNPEKKLKALKLALVISIKNMESYDKANEILNDVKLKKIGLKSSIINQWKKDINSKSTQTLSGDPNLSFIRNLNYSLKLQNELMTSVNSERKSQIYFELGKIFEQNTDIGLFNLPENYFEVCITNHPHTKLAKKCFYSLESHLQKGQISGQFTREEKNKIQRLSILAMPKSAKPSPSFSGEDN